MGELQLSRFLSEELVGIPQPPGTTRQAALLLCWFPLECEMSRPYAKPILMSIEPTPAPSVPLCSTPNLMPRADQAWTGPGGEGPSGRPGRGWCWFQLCPGGPLTSNPRAAVALQARASLSAPPLSPGLTFLPRLPILLPAVNAFSLVIVQHKPFLNKSKRNHSDLLPRKYVHFCLLLLILIFPLKCQSADSPAVVGAGVGAGPASGLAALREVVCGSSH